MESELGAHDHERVGHIVPRIAHEDELQALEAGGEVLLDREHVGDHLSRVELGGQAVPDGHARVGGQVLDDALGEAPVLDPVVHSTENTGRVLDGLLLPHLGRARIEVGHPHPQIPAGHLERAAGPRRGLLEQQDDVLALEIAVRGPGQLEALELRRQVDEVPDLIRGVVKEFEEVAAREADGHGRTFLAVHDPGRTATPGSGHIIVTRRTEPSEDGQRMRKDYSGTNRVYM